MVKKEDCAWITKDGFCRWHKEPCCRNNPGACAECVRPISERMHYYERRYMNNLRLDNDGKSACLHPNAAREHMYGYKVYRACTRKHRFLDFHSAMKKAIELNRKNGLVLAVYECPFCHGYHLTKQLRKSLVDVVGDRHFKAA